MIKIPSVLNILGMEKLLETTHFVSSLCSGTWAQTANPDYTEVRFLNELKQQSVDLVIDLALYFDSKYADSKYYTSILTCFDHIVDRLKDEVLSQGIQLESVDENTGKLTPRPILTVSNTPKVAKTLKCLQIMHEKLRKYPDLQAIDSSSSGNLDKIVSYRIESGNVVIDNVFLSIRVTADLN